MCASNGASLPNASTTFTTAGIVAGTLQGRPTAEWTQGVGEIHVRVHVHSAEFPGVDGSFAATIGPLVIEG